MKQAVSRFFIGLGIVLLLSAAYLGWQRTTPRRLSFDISALPSLADEKWQPSRPKVLRIRDLSIELPVFKASIKEGKWEATSEGVSYLTSSAAPGEVGNSIFYGHNWTNLLGRLTKAQPGQEIEIVFADGEVRRFIIEYTQVVTPDQTHILNQTEDARLTVYTCTGFLDSKRFVVTALLED